MSVPEEPEQGSADAYELAIRLPDGQRLQRRFRATTTVAVRAAMSQLVHLLFCMKRPLVSPPDALRVSPLRAQAIDCVHFTASGPLCNPYPTSPIPRENFRSSWPFALPAEQTWPGSASPSRAFPAPRRRGWTRQSRSRARGCRAGARWSAFL